MSVLTLIDMGACALIALGCVHETFLAGRHRKGRTRFFAYELHRSGYALLGAAMVIYLLGLFPSAQGTAIETVEAPWQGIAGRLAVAFIFAGRLVLTVFARRGCLRR